ncbi:MAG: CO dehydrogenase/CO-methylating acetyl-CoA synthase complex subunit beta [bacterium]|nr:CO dehydrogenase/CO-methylating acetyl-CoA synthase complex subunit beta [bacterium]
MSKIIATRAIRGAHKLVARAEQELLQALEQKPPHTEVKFPNTAYYLPISHGMLGMKIETLDGLKELLQEATKLLPPIPGNEMWLPYLGHTLDAGMAALFADEIIEAIKYTQNPLPYLPETNPSNGNLWLGAANDVIMRERGIEFVDGTAPGFAACVGYCPSNEIAVKIARDLQEKNLYVFLAADTDGKSMAQQLQEEGVQLGWDTRLVPFGNDVTSCIHALGFATRAALSFGGAKPGDYKKVLSYNKNRVFAFVLAFGPVDDEKHAQAAGAINFGFPTVAETDIGQILPTGVCTYEHVVSGISHDKMIEKALEVRGCKINITKVPIPVPYGPAFEGERIRKTDMHVEFGGSKTTGFEFVTSVGIDQINDGDIQIVGPDIDTVEEGSALPLGIWVEVAGRKMQPDFEPILERQVHHLLNGAEGLWHMGQRDIIWTRISKSGFARGLRLKDYGEIIHAKFLSEYPAIVDKVKVTMVTDPEEVEKRLAVALKVYDERNRRLESMTDESVETFYSCLLCQSFAPDHVCIITPERLGLCGAYNWLDGKAAYEINETGPNQPVKKGECLDPVRGVWKGIDEYVYSNSHKSVDSFSAYSIMDRPMTSCGCFEAICAYVPECNGVMVVNREFQGDTPVGMKFSTLAGNVGGGQQTPGFMGCGKVFLTSRKFLFAEGGYKRLVWMPKELKDRLAEDLNKRFTEQGVPDLMDKIADETVATEAHDVVEYLKKVGHPALEMEDMSEQPQPESPKAETPEPKAAELPKEPEPPKVKAAAVTEEVPVPEGQVLPSQLIAQIKDQVTKEIVHDLKASLTKEIVGEIIGSLNQKFFGEEAAIKEKVKVEPVEPVKPVVPVEPPKAEVIEVPSAAERISGVAAFQIKKDSCEVPIWTVKLGASKEEGGTRGKTYTIGGETCMPFHLWEGEMPHRPLVAMEVFDSISQKFPSVLREIYGDLLENSAEMARVCVDKYGAELISVRLEGTHPEKGNRTPGQAVQVVKDVLSAVDVPLIVTGHSHFDSNNEVLKTVAQACAGENLLLNWVEQDNYRTIAGAAIAYGHSIVSQSPIDVNIAKQMNILLTNMDIEPGNIVMDPLTSAAGYGIEYTYSVMERIRLTALNGDKMLADPMVVSPGQESIKIKELKATEQEFPAWGELAKRAAMWELATAVNLLYAGADLFIMYHPEAAKKLKETITKMIKN